MKACSSAQRKEAFKSIQYRRNVPTVQLLLDMKVQWSSTFIMLTHAKSCQEAIDEFVLELGLKEGNSEKRRKMTSLTLNSEEWTQVRLFCNILQVRITVCFDSTVLMIA
jgi:ABC-type cobalamin transport system ATPase subunit